MQLNVCNQTMCGQCSSEHGRTVEEGEVANFGVCGSQNRNGSGGKGGKGVRGVGGWCHQIRGEKQDVSNDDSSD